jgi:tRNA(adenine34) deaminase
MMTLHEQLMTIALEQARTALDNGEFPVGCVIADGKTILATGGRTGSRSPLPDETAHAEMAALRSLTAAGHPADPRRLTLYSTLEPCLMCFGAILIHGIHTIVYACEDAMGGGTGCDLSVLPGLYRRQKVTIIPGVLREKSLFLFKAFFTNPDNRYLQSTPLAAYILEQ